MNLFTMLSSPQEAITMASSIKTLKATMPKGRDWFKEGSTISTILTIETSCLTTTTMIPKIFPRDLILSWSSEDQLLLKLEMHLLGIVIFNSKNKTRADSRMKTNGMRLFCSMTMRTTLRIFLRGRIQLCMTRVRNLKRKNLKLSYCKKKKRRDSASKHRKCRS
jgi:hypothetical protein